MTDPCNTSTSDDEPGRANAPDWIRRAAIELFRRNGYDATSPRELSEAAGVGVGTLDRHIGSKEELLFEISIGLLRSALAEAEQAIAPIEEPERRLRALAAQLITHRVTHDHAWSVVLREDRALTAKHRAAVTAARHAYEALWSSVLADGATAGAWRPVDPVDLRGMLGMFLSTGSWLDPHGASSSAEVADRYVDLVLGGIGTTTPAPPLADTDPAGAAAATRKGPLAGLRVVEFAGIGPAPMAAMVLADLGATVLRIDRRVASGLGIERPLEYSYSMRSRHAISLDLKDPEGVETALALIDQADALIEGFRPGVMERLGLGPDEVLARNPRLVYGRVTGWGQTGPLARTAGHDINYLSVTGVLDAIGRPDEPPTVPLNLLGDYAGGALYLVVGLLSGVLEARHSGRGQVVDAAIVDGVANLASVIVGLVEAGQWQPERGTNVLDGGAFYYGVYECADGTWASIGPIEPKFLTELAQAVR